MSSVAFGANIAFIEELYEKFLLNVPCYGGGADLETLCQARAAFRAPR